jgi:dUTP pyrophosphatase
MYIMIMLKYHKLYPDVEAPEFATCGSACFDLRAHLSGSPSIQAWNPENKSVFLPVVFGLNNGPISIVIPPLHRISIPTGIIFDIPEGHSVRVHARSGLALKQGLVMVNAEGIVDSDYVEESKLLMQNLSAAPITVNHGDRVAQAELVKDLDYSLDEISERPQQKTTRAGGFGSTGVST